jgi:hypothetical protein
MRLCHCTDQKRRDGIAAEGFCQEDPPVGPAWTAPDRDHVWFASSKELAREKASGRSGWFVWIEAPDDTPEHLFPTDSLTRISTG